MGGRTSRRKGHNWERAICQRLRAVGFRAASCRAEAPAQDALGRDIVTDAPVCIQAKAGRTVKPVPALREAIAAAKAGEIPVAFLRLQHERLSIAVLPMDDLIQLLKEARGRLGE